MCRIFGEIRGTGNEREEKKIEREEQSKKHIERVCNDHGRNVYCIGISVLSDDAEFLCCGKYFGTCHGSGNFIPLKVSTMTMILNVALLIIGIVFVGKEFGGKTVITSLMLPVYLRIFETVTPDVPPLTMICLSICCAISGDQHWTGDFV